MVMSGIIKWMKRFILLVLVMYIFQVYLIEIDVKSKIMIIVTRANSSIKKVRTVSTSNSLRKETQKLTKPNSSLKEIGNITISNSPETEVRVIRRPNSPQKEVIMKLDSSKMEKNLINSTKENIIVANSSLNGMTKQHKEETMKPECLYNRTRRTGRVGVNLSADNIETTESWIASSIDPGGRYTPPDCKPKQMVAIIIPYRDREVHLNIFLRHMHPFLQRQQIEYGIFVIEMDQNLKFNRAILMNIGFVEALKLRNYTCFVFHDVDLLPEDDRIPYSCANMPQHLSVAVDKFNYRLPYEGIFGGACSIQTQHFRKVNGMSNMFFGWGGEDDDFRNRIRLNNLKILRPSIAVARYKMIKHSQDRNQNPERFCLLGSTKQRMRKDGLSNLKYIVKQLELRRLYTWVLVRVNETEQVQSDSYLFNFYKECAEKNKRHKKNGNGTIKARPQPNVRKQTHHSNIDDYHRFSGSPKIHNQNRSEFVFRTQHGSTM